MGTASECIGAAAVTHVGVRPTGCTSVSLVYMKEFCHVVSLPGQTRLCARMLSSASCQTMPYHASTPPCSCENAPHSPETLHEATNEGRRRSTSLCECRADAAHRHRPRSISPSPCRSARARSWSSRTASMFPLPTASCGSIPYTSG